MVVCAPAIPPTASLPAAPPAGGPFGNTGRWLPDLQPGLGSLLKDSQLAKPVSPSAAAELSARGYCCRMLVRSWIAPDVCPAPQRYVAAAGSK